MKTCESILSEEKDLAMSWSEVKVAERVFYNVEIMSEVGFYLNLNETLSFLEAKIGIFKEVLLTKRMKRYMAEKLMNLLVKQGWGEKMPNYGSKMFEDSQKEVMIYLKLLYHLGCDIGQELEVLIDDLVMRFPFLQRNEVKDFQSAEETEKAKICLGENYGRIMTRMGENFAFMSAPVFIVGGFGEKAARMLVGEKWGGAGGAAQGRKLAWGLNHKKSYLAKYGCLNEPIIEGLLAKMEAGGQFFSKMEIKGVHIDSRTAIDKLAIFLDKIGDSGPTIGLNGHIEHIQVSCELDEDGWRRLHEVMSSNFTISWGSLEPTAELQKSRTSYESLIAFLK